MIRIELMGGDILWVNPRMVAVIADCVDSQTSKIMIGVCTISLAGGAALVVKEGKDHLAMRMDSYDVRPEAGGVH